MSNILDRDVTNFVTDLRREYAKITFEPRGLRDFQKVIFKYLRFIRIRSGGRGLLIAADPGMGKTRIAIAVAAEFVGSKINGIDKVYFISQKSLHDNFESNIEKYKRETGKTIHPNYVSLNASNFGDKVAGLNFERSVVIFDEAHKFASMVVNGSESAVRLYTTLRDTKDAIFLFLTGSPIMNKAFEMVIYWNIIAGYALFPENSFEFNKYFGNGKNLPLYQNRIIGLSSFVHIDTASEDYPRTESPEVVHVRMSEEEYSLYLLEEEKEIRETAFKYNRRKIGTTKAFEGLEHSSSTYKVRTRQLCNCKAKIDWVTAYIVDNSDKFGSVYSQFIGDGGLRLVKKSLEATGLYAEFTPEMTLATTDPTKRYYITMTSDHGPEERPELQAAFNSAENLEKCRIQLVMCSSASAFGVHFNNVEYAMVLEYHWLAETIDQYFSRFIRYKSHVHLPKDRHFVKRIIMITDLPHTGLVNKDTERNVKAIEDIQRRGKEYSTDQEIYDAAIANQIENQLYYNATEATSIERILGLVKDELVPAYACAPTGEKLFTKDFYNDMQRPNLCVLNYATEVEAKQIMVDGKEYYYTSPESIFVYDERLVGYIELAHKTAEYKKINQLLLTK